MYLQNARWQHLADLRNRTFIVPLGSLEQHGPHLPLFTDSLIIGDIADRVERLRSDSIVILPVQWLGHSPHHRHFGCVSADFSPYVSMMSAICRSLVDLGARKILLLNGHGGNEIPCRAALRELKSEFASFSDLYIVYAAYWNLAKQQFNSIRDSEPGGMGHACEMETSIMLATHPSLVDMALAAGGGPSPQMGYRTIDMLNPPPYSLVNEFDEVSRNGVMGSPELATADKGRQFLDAATESVVGLLDEIKKWKFQQEMGVLAEPNPSSVGGS
jgi:creatinine amidohydrolase